MPDPGEDLERGRACFGARAWGDAYDALARADKLYGLDADDLERLALSAALTGRDEAFLSAMQRLHFVRLADGRELEAARAAFWVGFRLFSLGEPARASGWLARAGRIVACDGGECALRGYLMLPEIHQRLARGDDAGARAKAHEAAELGRRFDEADLVALGVQLEGRAAMRQGYVPEGLALVDEAMVAATTGELSPIVTGLVYCSVIASCREVYALDRAREWTTALARWCEAQPQLVTFTGSCLVHRSEVMELGGAWDRAIEEAERAAHLFEGTRDAYVVGDACYQQAEIHRLRGERDAARRAYERASRFGRDPQPGLALLRLREGKAEDAERALCRALEATKSPLARARLLPAYVEILVAREELREARQAAHELQAIADHFPTEVLRAMADHARGVTLLAEGEPGFAVAPLRAAFTLWRQAGAPYLAARVRVALAQACDALGDRDGARLERAGARQVFEELGARPDLAALDDAAPGEPRASVHGLTVRELEVMKLLATGMTNKAIATALFVSERTIDRHVSNIYGKLDISSRAAATAFAYEKGLV